MDSKSFSSPSSYIPEVKLPHDIATLLPSDPLAQLELAHRISCFAYAQKATQLESENQQLRESLSQKQASIKTLERKVGSLEVEVQSLQQKNAQFTDDQHKLAAEKTALIETVKKLNRDVTRLESFRKNLLQTLQDDDEVPRAEPSLAAINLSSDRLVAEALNNAATASSIPYVSAQASGGGNGLSYPTTPQKNAVQPGTMFNSGNGSQASRPSTSPSRVDGKEFFRQARQRLSSEQFTMFMQTIKDLNAGKETRENTLRRARELFGITNADLFGMFDALLSRHINAL